MNYCVRISCVQYGNAFVDAKNQEEAKEKAKELYNQRRIDWFEEEITDMLIDSTEPSEVERMEKETLEIMKETIEKTMKMEVGGIDYCMALNDLSDCTFLIDNAFSPESVLKIHGTTTCSELYDMLDKFIEETNKYGKEN